MSDSPAPEKPAAGRPAKRQKTDADLRRQRKREADRMAQKHSRERRRSHIDHLENMISILRKENGNDVTCELMETVLQLRAENDRLRRIINSAKTSLSLAGCEVATTSSTKEQADGSSLTSKAMRESTAQNTESRPEEPPTKDQESSEAVDQSRALMDIRRHASNDTFAQSAAPNRRDFLDYLSLQRGEQPAGPLHFTDSWMDKMANYGDNMRKRPNLDPFTFLGPLATTMPSPARPRQNGDCPGWQRSNRIYSQIVDTNPIEASQALALSSAHYADMIFKAVINGWAALQPEERNNPIMRTLSDMDQVFSELDPVSRAAFMYKSHTILKYHLDKDKRVVSEMPEWQRPLPSQRTKQHPIAVDFFVWPALRNRLVEGNHAYFSSSDFTEYFRRYYKFNWPFPFEDAYIYDKAADTYRISPIFERYHQNISYWGVQRPFLDRFPELAHDIICVDGPTPMNVGGARAAMMESGDVTPLEKMYSSIFLDGELTELFNNYPQVA